MKINRKLLLLFIVISLIKAILTYFILSPSIFSDEYLYIKMAQSFHDTLTFDIHGFPSDTYFPLYPILISISFIFNDVTTAYTIIKILNSFLSTLIIIPAYYISKEFLDNKKAVFVAMFVALLPMNVAISPYIMAENIFYTLFLTSIYFIYKSFTNQGYKYDILAGFFIGLSLLTKLAAVSLFFILFLVLLYKLFNRQYKEIHKKVILGLITFLIFLPWLIRNGLIFGLTRQGILGGYSGLTQASIFSYSSSFLWFFIYISFIFLSSLMMFLPLNFIAVKEKFKDKKLKIFTIISFVSISVIIIALSYYAGKSGIKETTWLLNLTGRPIGRYLEIILPLIIINGFITLYNYKNIAVKKLKLLLILSIPFILLSSQLMFFSLFPMNNMSLVEIGLANFVLQKFLSINLSIIISTFAVLLFLFFFIYLNKKKKLLTSKVINFMILFLIMINLLNFSIIHYNSKTWHEHPQEQLSLWIKDNISEDKVILIDSDDCGNFNKETTKVLCTKKRSVQLTALWLTNKVVIEPIEKAQNADYIITTKKLDLQLVKKTENEIYLYKSKSEAL